MTRSQTLEQLRMLHDQELYATGEDRRRRRTATNEMLLIASENGIRGGELAQALGLTVALINGRLERARAHANAQPLDPSMVPLEEFAAMTGVPLARARRLRRAGLIPSARWRVGRWWVAPADAVGGLTRSGPVR